MRAGCARLVRRVLFLVVVCGIRFGVSPDRAAMTGGGLCALDYDNDGWVDLFVVNSYSQADLGRWRKHGGLPQRAVQEHDRTVHERESWLKADLAVRGEAAWRPT
jgi:hypothetical protein